MLFRQLKFKIRISETFLSQLQGVVHALQARPYHGFRRGGRHVFSHHSSGTVSACCNRFLGSESLANYKVWSPRKPDHIVAFTGDGRHVFPKV
jgi:hypothetical protein